MKFVRLAILVCCCAMLADTLASAKVLRPSAAVIDREAADPANGSWYFAVSGDSRDCGNLIMPLMAQDISNRAQAFPVSFYWHLGDLRAIARIDCDWGMRMKSPFQCPTSWFANDKERTPVETEYVGAAWQDFIDNQVRPFEKVNVTFILGIGNHELFWPKTRDGFRLEFKEWLAQSKIEEQRMTDRNKHIFSDQGETYFHFVREGVDFINLDNAEPYVGFSMEQLGWLRLILKADAADATIKTIIVGMHEALPYSASRFHGMDDSCAGRCTGKIAYDMLDDAQRTGKHVYVLASHSHRFEKNIFKGQPEHKGHELEGWIVGTAGAEQYRNPQDSTDKISYGYMRVEVKSDGTIKGNYVEVKPASPPNPSDKVVKALTDFCFAENKRPLPQAKTISCNCTQP